MKNVEKPKANRFEMLIRRWLAIDKKMMVLFFLALAIRLGLFVAIAPWEDRVWQERIVVSDAGGYHQIAINLLKNHVYSVHPLSSSGRPISTSIILRTPVYPFFVAGVYAIFGYRVYIVLLLQILIGAIACLIIYRIGNLLFNKKVGFLAGCLLAVDLVSSLFANTLMTETLFTFLFLVSIYFLVRFLRRSSIKYLVWGGLFMGLATLCRPISLYFPVFLMPFFVFSSFVKRTRLVSRITNGLVFVLIFLLTLSPWLIRNTIVSGFPHISFIGRNLLAENAAYLEQARTGRRLDEIRREFGKELKNLIEGKNLSEAEQVRIVQRLGIKKILEYPIVYAKVHLAGALPMLVEPGSSEFWRLLGREPRGINILSRFLMEGPQGVIVAVRSSKSFSQICYIVGTMIFLGVIYLGLIVGLIELLLKREYSVVILLLAILGYFLLAVGPIGNMRYRVPIMPYVMLLAAYGFTRFSRAHH